MNDELSLNIKLQNLKRIDEAIDRADGKSATLAAANVGLLSLLVALVGIAGAAANLTITSEERTVGWILFGLYVLTGAGSTLFSMMALFPRLRPKSQSHFYFGTLARVQDLKILERQLNTLSLDDINNDVIDQIYHTASIAAYKYKWLKKSVYLLLVSGLCWSILLIAMYILALNEITS